MRWFDPVSYQFCFLGIGEEDTAEVCLNVYREMINELRPYILKWFSRQGRFLGEKKKKYPVSFFEVTNEETLERYLKFLSDFSWPEYSFSPYSSGKAFSSFAVSLRKVPKEWREQTSQYTQIKKRDEAERILHKEWLYEVMTCLTEDLRGIYLPSSCFIPNEIPFVITYARKEYPEENDAWKDVWEQIFRDCVLPAERFGDMQSKWFYRFDISVPRFVVDSVDSEQTPVTMWLDRLASLSGMFEKSTGYIKMDSARCRFIPRQTTGNDAILPGFAKRLPDFGWAICLNEEQMETIGGLDYIRGAGVFHEIRQMPGGNTCFILTPDVSVIPKEKAKQLWSILSPHITFYPRTHQVADLPISLRYGFERDQLSLNNIGDYEITNYKIVEK